MSISDIERDIQTPSEQTVEALATALGFPPRSLAAYMRRGTPIDPPSPPSPSKRGRGGGGGGGWFRVTDHSWSPLVRPGDMVGVSLAGSGPVGSDLVVATVRLRDGRVAEVLGITGPDGTSVRAAMLGDELDADVVCAHPVSWINRRTA